MLVEYLELRRDQICQESFLDFLKDKLEIEGYWNKVGLV